MNSNRLFGMVAALAMALALSSSAFAQDAAASDGGGGGGGGGMIASGGVVDQWRLGADFHLLAARGGAAAGLQVFADFPLHQFFLLGGEFNFAARGGGAVLEFNVKPTGRIPLHVGSGILEPYITVPMGLGVWTGGGGAGFAWNVLFGTSYFFNDFIGIHGDLGAGGVTSGFGGGGFVMNLGAQFLF